MEPFSLLKYWRPSSTIDAGGEASSFTSNNSSTITTIVTAVNSDEESGDDDVDDDGGPFFDLEFAVPCEENREIEGNAQAKAEEECDSDDESDGENRGDFEFALSSRSSGGGDDDQSDPSDDLFFKGSLVSIDTSPTNGSEQNSKSLFLQKSANRLRILMLKLKKSKCNENQKTDANGSAPVNENQVQNRESLNKPATATATAGSKFFTVKFKVEEVPIISLFTRDGSKSQKQPYKQIDREIPPVSDSALSSTSSDDKRYSKELLMQKYLNKVKPLYVHVSRRYAEKLKLGSEKTPSPSNVDKDSSSPAVKPEKEKEVSSESTNVKGQGQKQGNLQAGLKIVYKHLGKSRSGSASSAVAASPPFVAVTSRRCDDSLLDQHDGIQGAILHCKRSFNSSRDCSSAVSSVLAPSRRSP